MVSPEEKKQNDMRKKTVHGKERVKRLCTMLLLLQMTMHRQKSPLSLSSLNIYAQIYKWKMAELYTTDSLPRKQFKNKQTNEVCTDIL